MSKNRPATKHDMTLAIEQLGYETFLNRVSSSFELAAERTPDSDRAEFYRATAKMVDDFSYEVWQNKKNYC